MMAPKGLDVPFFCFSSAKTSVRSLPREGLRSPEDLGVWYRFVSLHRTTRSLSKFGRLASGHATFV